MEDKSFDEAPKKHMIFNTKLSHTFRAFIYDFCLIDKRVTD